MGKLNALLDLHDERATLGRHCESVVLGGRESIAVYRSSKLERRTYSAFTLDDMLLTDCGVMVDYRGYDGKAIRIQSTATTSLGINMETAAEVLSAARWLRRCSTSTRNRSFSGT
jgi:hypothetical protein